MFSMFFSQLLEYYYVFSPLYLISFVDYLKKITKLQLIAW